MDQMVTMMSSLNEHIVVASDSNQKSGEGKNAWSVIVMRGKENDQYLMKNVIYFTPRYIHRKKKKNK